MKKEYKRPIIIVDDFELTERIAGPCAERNDTIITNFHDSQCVLKYEGYFADGFCEMGDYVDLECLDTYAETEGYFWS